ncbi:hypothetical protein [Mediterraneibacter gnavus]|uniref:Uncharacterized protein n=1 Tax=Mediterraneibacter gnavus TaxID=33038 RepID=A0A2N5Q036_MEDGN|nr:hypothetical protein [Mediterraneibacter gnavus]PLT87019.1 hypothetical protein CDL20_07765 [Mediterraneibacter gnavus]
MKTNEIIKEINNKFAETYKNASPFVDSGELWNFCMDTIKNPITLSNIVFANDMGIPPVKSLVTIYKRKMFPDSTFQFTGLQSQYMGALMGFVFKFVLGYQSQKERCKVEFLGVKTATRFLEGPVIDFEE